ncbi:MAG: hypothetical protein JSU63_00025 [Phycisphaerales bacterium]|nr:MAG: hypothetical protein JSU63_00025 [Phycisphaerales bacterium]
MARKVRLVVVCEDLMHEVFARAFLYRRGMKRHQLTFKSAPQGDAKQYVCTEVCCELTELRRSSGTNRGILYLIDADNLTVDRRRQTVISACRKAQVPPPQDHEPVFGFIPKWEVENWLAYLRGETVDESSNRYPKYSRCESEAYPLVEDLGERCERQSLPDAPPSLQTACQDYPRFLEWIRSG